MKRRFALILAGAALLAIAFVVFRTAVARNDPYYQLPQSVRQEVTEIAIKSVIDGIAQQDIPYLVYVILDESVDTEKAIASLPKLRAVTYRRGDANVKLPRDNEQLLSHGNIARAVSVKILTESAKRVVVSTTWSSASELGTGSSIVTLERRWWRWVIIKTQVTTAV